MPVNALIDSDRLTLAIEMSNPSMWADPLIAGEVAVGVVVDDRIRSLGVELITQRTPRDDALAPAIDRLLRRLEIQPARLDRIAVSGGPGGFTSVRIALTTAKIIAEAVGARVVVVPTDEIVARTFRKDRSDPGVIAVTLASKRDSAWCAVFESCAWDDGPWPAASIEGVMTAESFSATAGSERVEMLIADAHVPQGFFVWAERLGVEVTPPRVGTESALVASCFHEAVDPVKALPIYPREPEAVTKWRDRHGFAGA